MSASPLRWITSAGLDHKPRVNAVTESSNFICWNTTPFNVPGIVREIRIAFVAAPQTSYYVTETTSMGKQILYNTSEVHIHVLHPLERRNVCELRHGLPPHTNPFVIVEAPRLDHSLSTTTATGRFGKKYLPEDTPSTASHLGSLTLKNKHHI